MEDWIASVTGARRARRLGRVQNLWGDYGEVFRVALDGGVARTAIIKRVSPPRSARDTISDARKRRSYDVELAFYQHYAPRCDASCRVAALYGSRVSADEWLLVFEDLDAAGFTARHDEAERVGLEACLAWLAAFHARFLEDACDGLWPTGTYWHLATRRDELAAITDRALRAAAETLDAQLSAARFQTLLHGDPKDANFCFTPDGRAVAAVDFQYAGRGCPMKDVAYLLYGRADEEAHLPVYFRRLRAALDPGVDADALEAEARALFPVARDDFRRFLAGWRG
ncbi:MAG: phosphotransferase [Kofleriaceae bacterium]|nr:phosphotransferase [Kofleriaceae bacterium]